MIETTLALSLALGAMNAPLATTAQLKTVSQVPPAQANGPVASPAVWRTFVDAVARGERKTAPGASTSVVSIVRGIIWTDDDKWVYISRIRERTLPDGGVEIVSASITEIHYVMNRGAGTETTYTRSFSADGSGRLLSATDLKSVRQLQPLDAESVDGPTVVLNIADRKVARAFENTVEFLTK